MYVRFTGTTIISSSGQGLLMGFYPDNKVKERIFEAKDKYGLCAPVFWGPVKGGEYNEKENYLAGGNCVYFSSNSFKLY